MNGVERRPAGAAFVVPSRFLRAAVFAVVAVALGAVGHVAASGELPAVEHCALLGLAVALVSVAGVWRERGLVEILLALAALQAGLHQGFGWLHDATGADAFTGSHAADHGTAMGAAGGWSWPMVAAHGLTVLACAWWLRRGEAAWWRRARAVAAAVVALVKGLLDRPRPRPAGWDPVFVPGAWSVPGAWCRPVVAGTPRRGPPRTVTPVAA